MNKDEIKGKVEQGKGYLKDKAGEAMDDPALQAEGKIEQGQGKVREAYGEAKRKVSDAMSDDDESAEEATR
jgi:uncharacterized protein YjbJ (UPF0337 family)